MASKVTPLYAETRILLNLWALDKTPASKSKFVPSGKPYASALDRLTESEDLAVGKKRGNSVYSLAEEGMSKLAAGLQDESFRFSTNIGPKTTNALLSWLREKIVGFSASHSNGQAPSDSRDGNGSAASIESYEDFSKAALSTYDRLNRDYNLGDLVPIYRIRREMGDRLSRQNFNEWLLDVQANDLIQLMGGELSNVTADQLEDSVAIPGGRTRFYVKRL